MPRTRLFMPLAWWSRLPAAVLALAACGILTVATMPLDGILDLVHIALLYLLNVVFLAVRFGRFSAILGAVFGSLLFAHVFVPPKFSLAITELSYLITAIEMLIVALVIGHLTAGLRQKAQEAASREQMLRSVYTLAADLAGAADLDKALQSVIQCLDHNSDDLKFALFLKDETQTLRLVGISELPTGVTFEDARRATASGIVVDEYSGEGCTSYFPLNAISGCHGVVAIACPQRTPDTLESQRFIMLASLVAVTIERIRFADLARNATLKAEAEQLRSSILSALSHDIRTPLTSVVGISEALSTSLPPLSARQQDMAQELNELAGQMNHMVSNLLDMARLQTGRLRLRQEWQPIEDVVGVSLQQIKRRYPGRIIRVSIPGDFPLLEFDTVLIERVICNLLENAIKFSHDGEVLLKVDKLADKAAISILDEGPGIPPGAEEKIFEPFVQVRSESSLHGVGLGLAICQTIIIAHNGEISAANRMEGGACMTFTLPCGIPPEAEEAPVEEGKTHE
jgi:two-component system sensor histidine kinase KdpD